MRVLFLLLTLLALNQATKVLLYSAPQGFSHVQLMASVAKTLADANHSVTVIHPVIEKKFKQYWDKIDVTKVYVDADDNLKEIYRTRDNNLWETTFLGNINTLNIMTDLQMKLCEVVIQQKDMLEQLKKNGFDVAIVEVFGACGFGLANYFEIPNLISVSSIGTIDVVSDMYHTPNTPSYIPATASRSVDDMNFFERVVNFLWFSVKGVIYKYMFQKKYETLFARHGMPFEFDELVPRASTFFLANQFQYLEFSRPISARIKYIGGITTDKSQMKTIDKKFQDILDYPESKGVVLISFGSVVLTKVMPWEVKQAVVYLAKNNPEYQIIFKMDKDDDSLMNILQPNLHLVPWLPQRELLANDRLKLFVSHGGLNSLLEGTLNGKPMVLIPIFGDQYKNAATMHRKKTTTTVDKNNINNNTLNEVVRNMLNDESFTKNAKRLQQLVTAKKETAQDVLLETVEMSHKFGRIHELDLIGYNLNFIQYFSLDVILFLFIVVVIVIYTSFMCIRRVLCGSSEKTVSKIKKNN